MIYFISCGLNVSENVSFSDFVEVNKISQYAGKCMNKKTDPAGIFNHLNMSPHIRTLHLLNVFSPVRHIKVTYCTVFIFG